MKLKLKKIHINKSKLHGKGLFALKRIKKGEKIFTIRGKKVKFLIHNEKEAKKAEMDWIGMGKNQWIDPTNYHGSYLNHSCNPNTGIKSKKIIVARRNIEKGEEITFDYSTNEADVFWELRCSCGEATCRKIIKSIQFLPKEIFKKHKEYIPKFYKMVYNEYNRTNFKDEEEMKKAWVNFIKKTDDGIKKRK